jgi:hypothetical protein
VENGFVVWESDGRSALKRRYLFDTADMWTSTKYPSVPPVKPPRIRPSGPPAAGHCAKAEVSQEDQIGFDPIIDLRPVVPIT